MSDPERNQFRLMHRLRVRWSEVDLQGIVFNPHYLTYVDTAFTDYWSALAVAYEDIPPVLGGDLFVKKSTIEYHGSARLDDLIDVGIRCERIGTSSMRMAAALFRGNTLLVTAELIYVFADAATRTSKPVPEVLRALMQDFEAGHTITDTEVGDWAALAQAASGLRRAVFVEELGLPEMLAQDAADTPARHVVLRNRLGQVLGTGRLAAEGEGEGRARIGRLAVRRNARTHGWGRHLITSLLDEARRQGHAQVVLSALQSAQGFYATLGFQPVGEVFMEEGMPHQEMLRTL